MFISNIHKSLVETYEAEGNYSQALFHAKAYTSLQDSISKVKAKQDIFEISEQYQSEKKSLEIAIQKWMLVLISICLLLALALAGFILKILLKIENATCFIV